MLLSSLANLHLPLGWFGPADFGELPSKVVWIDCSDVGATYENNGDSDWGHQYFRNSPAVTADVHQVLDGVPPDKVKPRLPDRVFPNRKFVIRLMSTVFGHAQEATRHLVEGGPLSRSRQQVQ